MLAALKRSLQAVSSLGALEDASAAALPALQAAQAGDLDRSELAEVFTLYTGECEPLAGRAAPSAPAVAASQLVATHPPSLQRRRSGTRSRGSGRAWKEC